MNEPETHDDIIDVEPKVISDGTPEAPRVRPQLWFRILPPVGLALACAIGGGWLYRDLISGYFPSEEVQALSKRVGTIESTTRENQKRVDAVVALTEELKAKLSAAQSAADKSTKQNADTATLLQSSTTEVAGLKQELEKVAAVTADLQARLTGNGVAVADPTLAARLAQVEKQIASAPVIAPVNEVSDQTANLKLMKTQIAQGVNFAAALAPMARALPAAPGLDVLGAERTGLVNANTLAAELDGIRATLPKPPEQIEETGVWASVKGAFSKLVRIKGQGSEDWGTAAAKASAFAVVGDLEQASAIFPKASSETPAPLKAWADKAQRRLNLEKATETFASALTRAGLAKE